MLNPDLTTLNDWMFGKLNNLLSDINSSINHICILQSVNDHSIQCACDLCKLREFGLSSKQSRRTLSNTDKNTESESFQVAALTNYVIMDFIEVNQESRIWEASTYVSTLSIILTFSLVWMTLAFNVFMIERYINTNPGTQ